MGFHARIEIECMSDLIEIVAELEQTQQGLFNAAPGR